MANNKITIQAIINKDIETVWDCYTSPEHITKWNFASDDWCCPRASNDLHIGGKYNARMEAKDGSFGFDFEAIYDEVNEQELLKFTMSDGREVIVTFSSIEEGTSVVVTFDPESQNPIEMQRDGWQAILNNFKTYTESL